MKKQNFHEINGEMRISSEFNRMMDFFISIDAIILDFKELPQLEDYTTAIVFHKYNNEMETNTLRERSIWN
jgi:hypothetical protein